MLIQKVADLPCGYLHYLVHESVAVDHCSVWSAQCFSLSPASIASPEKQETALYNAGRWIYFRVYKIEVRKYS